jgi:aspartate carbamoyltransferase catalytic subunit
MDRLDTRVGILNAGDGQHEHPTQGLLDLFTICCLLNFDYPRLGLLAGKKIAIVGDIIHSRVARSNIWCLTASRAEVHLAAPPTLLPKWFGEIVDEDHSNQESSSPIPRQQLFIHSDIEPALKDADFVMTLRLQKERMSAHLLPSLREYHQRYGITRDRLKLCKPDVKILHPGPVNRGVEISSDLMDDPQFSLISQQVTNGVAVRMALLYLMGSGSH